MFGNGSIPHELSHKQIELHFTELFLLNESKKRQQERGIIWCKKVKSVRLHIIHLRSIITSRHHTMITFCLSQQQTCKLLSLALIQISSSVKTH